MLSFKVHLKTFL